MMRGKWEGNLMNSDRNASPSLQANVLLRSSRSGDNEVTSGKEKYRSLHLNSRWSWWRHMILEDDLQSFWTSSESFAFISAITEKTFYSVFLPTPRQCCFKFLKKWLELMKLVLSTLKDLRTTLLISNSCELHNQIFPHLYFSSFRVTAVFLVIKSL